MEPHQLCVCKGKSEFFFYIWLKIIALSQNFILLSNLYVCIFLHPGWFYYYVEMSIDKKVFIAIVCKSKI